MAIVISSRITMFHSVAVITSSRTTVCSELGGCQRLMGIDNRHVLKCCTPLGIDYRHVLQRCSLRGIDNTHRRGVWGHIIPSPRVLPPLPAANLATGRGEGGRTRGKEKYAARPPGKRKKDPGRRKNKFPDPGPRIWQREGGRGAKGPGGRRNRPPDAPGSGRRTRGEGRTSFQTPIREEGPVGKE